MQRQRQDIRVSEEFPDDDAEEPTSLFDHSSSGIVGIAVTPTRILLNMTNNTTYISHINFFTYSGTHQSSETVTYNTPFSTWTSKIDYLNGDILYLWRYSTQLSFRFGRFNLQTPTVFDQRNTGANAIAHTRLGIALFQARDQDYFSALRFRCSVQHTRCRFIFRKRGM